MVAEKKTLMNYIRESEKLAYDELLDFFKEDNIDIVLAVLLLKIALIDPLLSEKVLTFFHAYARMRQEKILTESVN